MKSHHFTFRLFLTALTTILCICLFAPVAEAATVDSGEWGQTSVDDIRWKLDSDGTLTISGTGRMEDCWHDGYQFYCAWDEYLNDIKKVVIKEGVTYIGESSFTKAKNLTSVTIPDSVEKIGNFAFSGCTSLKAISFGTGLKETGIEIFRNCTSLTSVTLPNANVDYGNDLFNGCTSLKTVTIPVRQRIISGGMFEKCSSLTSVSLHSKITTISGGAFEGSGLTSISIPSSVTTIGNAAFRDCAKLKNITIPDSVTSLSSNLFEGCTALESVTLPNSITEMGYGVFAYCSSLKKIVVPASVTSMSHTFEDAYGLKRVFFTGNAPAKMGNCLFGNITVNAYYPSNASGWTSSVRKDYEGNVKWIAYTPLAITAQPTAAPVEEGEKIRVKVAAEGMDLTYKWYYAAPGSNTFRYTDSFTGNTYSLTMSEARSGRRVYCVVSDKYGNSIRTDTVTLQMKRSVKITAEPKSVYVQMNKSAKATVTATGDGLQYQWYVKDPGADKYVKSSNTTSTYSFRMVPEKSERRIYCVITDAYGNTVKSKTVAMRMSATITQQPTSVEVASGKKAVVSVEAVGKDLTYKWYYANPGSSTFRYTDSFTSDTYSVKMTSARDGRKVYCVITDSYGKSVKTKTVTLSMS